MKKMTARAADAADLVIEFSTLGEYGLEYIDDAAVDQTATVTPRQCEARNASRTRSGGKARRTRGARRRSEKPTLDPGRPEARGSVPARPDTGVLDGPVRRAAKLPEALRPPRIALSWQQAA